MRCLEKLARFVELAKSTQPGNLAFLIVSLLMSGCVSPVTDRIGVGPYDPSPGQPYGRPNPAAPSELAQFNFMIGRNDCSEQRRNGEDGSWSNTRRTWDARYTLNGYGIIDSGSSGATVSTNVRVFDEAAGLWNVTFFSMPTYSSGTWSGNRVGERIVLKRPQLAPGGAAGFSRLTFFNISEGGFEWAGEWVSEDERVVYPFWKIQCTKVDAAVQLR